MHSDPCQKSKMERFSKIRSILDVSQGSEYTSDYFLINIRGIIAMYDSLAFPSGIRKNKGFIKRKMFDVTFTVSKSTIESLEEGVKCVQSYG